MKRLALLGMLCAVALIAFASQAGAASDEPPCEVASGAAGTPSAEWCEEELQGWEREKREDERREAREDREVANEEQAAAAGRREAARHRREWAHKPTVTLRIAQVMAARTIRNAGYENGWVKCRGGRIDRTHWSCQVNLFYQCLRSRMRVWGAGYRNGQALYGTLSGHFHQCRA